MKTKDIEIREVYDGNYEGLSKYIERLINKSHYKLDNNGLLFVGVVMNYKGKSHKADYTMSRIRPNNGRNRDEEWLLCFRLSYLLQSLAQISDKEYCKVGVIIRRLNI